MGLRDRRRHRKALKQRADASAATAEAVSSLGDAVGRFTSSTTRYLGLSTSRALDDLGSAPALRTAKARVGGASDRAGKVAETAKRKTSRWLTVATLLGFVAVAKKVREQPVPPEAHDPGRDDAPTSAT